jgi:hypothetical protein
MPQKLLDAQMYENINQTFPIIISLLFNIEVNEFRECLPEVIEKNGLSVKLSLTCFIEFEGNSKYEIWERDVSQLITIEFDIDDITICEIRIFTNSFMPFNRCGSADIPLHSTMEFIKSGDKYGRNPYYKYKCDEGFELEGNEDVRCGLNNQWLDTMILMRGFTNIR